MLSIQLESTPHALAAATMIDFTVDTGGGEQGGGDVLVPVQGELEVGLGVAVGAGVGVGDGGEDSAGSGCGGGGVLKCGGPITGRPGAGPSAMGLRDFGAAAAVALFSMASNPLPGSRL